MMGAIIGDIVGSVYEWRRIKTKDFPLFREDCFFTDDTVMTCAVAGSINRSLILHYLTMSNQYHLLQFINSICIMYKTGI